MATNEDNLLEICHNINQFMKVYEGNLQEADPDYIINSFKLAKFVEDVLQRAEEQESLDEFLSLFRSYSLENNKRQFNYPSTFYQRATSNLLSKYFQSNNDCCDIAVKMFLAFKSQADLCDALTNIITEAESIKSISNYVLLHNSEIDWTNLSYDLIINAWNDELCTENSQSISKAIDSMLNVYKIEQNLKTLLFILNSNEATDDLKDLILSKLRPKMSDRTALSEKFWLALLKAETIDVIVDVSTKISTFCELYLDFIVYLISMFNYEDDSWIIDSNTICSSISFTQAYFVLKKFYISKDVKLSSHCRARIKDAKINIGTNVWFEIENILKDFM